MVGSLVGGRVAFAYTGHAIETRTVNCSNSQGVSASFSAATSGSGQFVFHYSNGSSSGDAPTQTFSANAGDFPGLSLGPPSASGYHWVSVTLYYTGQVNYDPTTGHFLHASCT